MPWINLTDEEAKFVRASLDARGVPPAADIIAKIDARLEPRSATDQAYIDAVETDDELEIDHDAVVSPGGDPGAWVMAWVWVSDEQAGIEELCRDCGEPYDHYSDGYNGRCPTCADKAEGRADD